jgi:hypothetical protein
MQNLVNGKALSFKGFVTEGETADRLSLITMGIGSTLRLLEARVNWEVLDEPKSPFGGRGTPFINWKLYEAWPKSGNIERWDDWADEVPGLMEAYGEEGDTALVDRYLMEIARENEADVIHVTMDDDWIDVRTGQFLPSPNKSVQENSSRDYKLLHSMGLATPAGLQVNEIEPEAKDIERAQTMSNIWGSDAQAGAASKMAKLITDPVKMVRRAKAVAQACRNTDVHHQFAHQMVQMGFTLDQVRAIFGAGVRTHAPRDLGPRHRR